MKPIPARFAPPLFMALMALLMSGVMSLVLTVVNRGFLPDLLFIWLRNWSIAFVVALPAIAVCAPLVRRLVTALTGVTPPEPGTG